MGGNISHFVPRWPTVVKSGYARLTVAQICPTFPWRFGRILSPLHIQCSQKVSFRPETGTEFPQDEKNPKIFGTSLSL